MNKRFLFASPYCSLSKNLFRQANPDTLVPGLLYKENHSLYEWFKKAYGDE